MKFLQVAELRQKLVLKALIKKNGDAFYRSIANFDESLPCRAHLLHGLNGSL
jgi:hypothetical protein